MLSINDYNHLKLLYEQFFKTNQLLKEMFTNKDWDNIDSILSQKDDLIRKIIFFEKPRKQDILDNKELVTMKKQLIELEKTNIHLVVKMQAELRQELNGVSKKKKILKTYEPSINKTKSTLDIVCDD